MGSKILTRKLLSLLLNRKILSIGTNYFPTTERESDYVEMFEYTETMLMELKPANITSSNIIQNLLKELGPENIPNEHQFIEIKSALNQVDEYALVSSIVMGGDRYLYVELDSGDNLLDIFADIIVKEKGTIVETSSTEIISRLLTKNDAIRVAIELVRIGLNRNVRVHAAVGMTGAASIERTINLSKVIGNSSGLGFTKLGGEYALVLNTPFARGNVPMVSRDYYLFIDIIDSTGYIKKYGKDVLVKLMTAIKFFIEKECDGHIEGYRKGGDDLIAKFRSKDAAMRAAVDSAWHALNNGAKIRAGIGNSRKEAGEKAQLVDDVKLWHPVSLIVFDLADGLYAYYVPSTFTSTIVNLLTNHKAKLFTIGFITALATAIGFWINIWFIGIIVAIIFLIYAVSVGE